MFKYKSYRSLTKRTFNQPAIDESCFEGRYILSQSSGRKDNKGVMIYQDDILSDKWRLKVYINDEGTFMVANKLMATNISLKKYLYQRKKAGCEEEDCVVIGNIYKNPELLNANN